MSEFPLKKVDMAYVRLGSSGLKVSKIILGCMGFGHKQWAEWVTDGQEAIDMIKEAYHLGVNTFDTADVYSAGHSEIILGKALKELNVPRESYVVMTKVFGWHAGPEYPGARFVGGTPNPEEYGLVNQGGLSRKHIFDSVKASLKRLNLDYIDVYQCHRFDVNTPIEETMKALDDIVKAGYVRYIGMSSCYAWQFHAMQNYAIKNGLTTFISMQNQHSLLYREEEREMNPLCEHLGVGTIPWSPLAMGVLARPWGQNTTRSDTDPWAGYATKGSEEACQAIVSRVSEVAKKKNATMAQIALAWLYHKPAVAAPIIGTTNIDKLKDLIGGLKIQLEEDEVKVLEEAYIPREFKI